MFFLGGGGQFGVVVEWVFAAFSEIGPITSGALIYPSPGEEYKQVFEVWKVLCSLLPFI